MPILVVGAGAIGGLLGTTLTRAGHKVDYVETASFADNLMETGIVVHKDRESRAVFPNRVFTSIDDVPDEPYDLLILGVKAYDVSDVLSDLSSRLGKTTCFMTPQNGIGIEEFVSEKVGSRKVLSASVTIPVSVPGPGEIRIEKKGKTSKA